MRLLVRVRVPNVVTGGSHMQGDGWSPKWTLRIAGDHPRFRLIPRSADNETGILDWVRVFYEYSILRRIHVESFSLIAFDI